MAGIIEQCVFLGNCIHVSVRLPGGTSMTAEVARNLENFRSGEHVHLWWHPQDEIRDLPDPG